MDHSSGDHTSFTGMSWPCIQVNLGTTSDEDTEMLSTTSAAAHSTTLRDNASNPYDWTDFQYNTEPIYADGTNFADYYQEGGDFYGENCDRRLDDVSHTAVYDDTEEIERSVDDFQDDFDCDLMSNLSTSLPVYTSEIPTAVPSPYEAAVQEETGWYQSSYGEEFMNDIKFLEDFWRLDRPLLRYAMIDDWNQKLEDAWRDSLIKRKLNRSSSNIGNRRLSLAMTDEQLDDHETLSLIIDTIKIPSQINEGIRMLHEFHLCRPQLDLRPYVEEFDFYKKRFIIWGLNYYFNVDEQKRKNSELSSNKPADIPMVTEEEAEHDAKMKILSCKMLQPVQEMNQVSDLYWNILLDWFTDYYDFKLNKTISSVENLYSAGK